MSTYTYKVRVVFRNGKRDETGEIRGIEAQQMAQRQAAYWTSQPDTKHVQILRAATIGLNAGKYFLHELQKG